MKFIKENKNILASLLCFLLLFALVSSVAHAANTATVVDLVRYLQDPVPEQERLKQSIVRVVDGERTFRVRFEADEKLCLEKYGKNWSTVCTRPVGNVLPKTDDIKMTPEHLGGWQWRSHLELVFYPYEPWPSDTAFTVQIGEKSLPKYTVITNNISFRTRPISTRIQADFKFDPQHYENMMVSGSVRFNYPMDKESVLKRFSVMPVVSTAGAASPATPAAQLLLGENTTSFSSSLNTLYFSTPVLKMPQDAQSVLVHVDKGIEAVSGGIYGRGEEMFAIVPAKDSIFKVLSYSRNVISMPDLSAKQTFTCEFSLPVLPKDALAHITVVLMPRERVQSIGLDAEKKGEKSKITKQKAPYKWWSITEVTTETLKYATPVAVELISNPDVPTRFVTYALKKDLEAGRYLYFYLKNKLKGPDDFVLAKNYENLLSVPSLQGELSIMQEGAVLTLDGEKKLALYARNADSVNYEVSQIRPEFLSLYVENMGNNFKQPSFSQNMSDLASISVLTKGKIPLQRNNAEEAQFASLDLKPFLKDGEKGLFYVSVESVLDGRMQRSDGRFVMLTDIGLIRKENVDNTSMIYVVSLSSGKPMSKVLVQVLGKNGIAVFEGKSDKDGIVPMPDLLSYTREKKPTVLVAHDGEDLAFLPFNDYQRELDVYRFDVRGKAHVDDGLYGYVFTQRDLYRPGESAYFGVLLKQGDFDSKKLKDMPLQAFIRDPRGNIIERKKMNVTDTGLGEISFALPKNVQTGLYTLYVENTQNSGVLVSKNFHVEEFQPQTLRLDIEFEAETKDKVSLDIKARKGWFLPSELQFLRADIKLMNLFGTPATGNLLRANAFVAPTTFAFKEYADWKFFDAAVLGRKNQLELDTTNTDENGVASFNVLSSLYENSTALLTVVANAFDASGGDSVQKQKTIMVSPLIAVLGWKSASNLNYISQSTKASLEIIALDSTLKPYDYGSFTWELYEIDYVRSLVKDRRGEFNYSMERKENLVNSSLVALPAKAITLDLDTKKSGEKMLVAKDAQGRTVLRLFYTVAGDALAQFGEEKNPDLRAKLNKTEYDAGEEMEIYMNLPYDGAGLITIERDKVFTQAWFKGKRGEHVQKITLTDNFEGKAYVNILYFRGLQDEDIFTKPSANIILPFTANLKARELDFSMEIIRDNKEASILSFIPRKKDKEFVARPGTDFSVRIRSPKAAKAIVFAVDEGILQMTNYQSPDPIKELLVRRALEVRTYQYFDLLMPEYSLMQKAIPTFGGGLAMARALGATANPFARKGQKPAVFWSGIVDVDENGTVVNIPVPATFNGQLRIMAVACSAEAVASVQEDVLVQAEVVMQPSLPLFLAPSDEFDVTLTLTDMLDRESAEAKGEAEGELSAWTGANFAQKENVETKGKAERTVNFSVNMSPALELVSELPSTLELLYAKQKTLTIRFRVKTETGNVPIFSILGEQEIDFMVSGKTKGASVVSMPVSLSVRPPQAKQTRTKMGYINPDDQSEVKSQDIGSEAKTMEIAIPLDRNMYAQFAQVSASISSLPLPFIQAMTQMLREYPYHCTEQYVSKALPLLTMLRHKGFAPQGEDFSENALKGEIMDILHILASRYKYNGYFAMWPGNYGRTPLLYTVYVADFVTQAMNMGISVPSVLRVDLLRRLERNLSSKPDSLEDARAYAYGAWVLTRNGVITSNILANLTAWLDMNVANWQKDIVAPLMAASMKLMMQEKASRILLDGYTPDALSAWAWTSSLDGLAQRSLYLTILAMHFPERLAENKTQKVLEEVLYFTIAEKYVSLSAAQASRALMLYSIALDKDIGAKEQSLYFIDAHNKKIVLPSASAEPTVKEGTQANTKQSQGDTIPERMISTDSAQIISQIAAVQYSSSIPAFYQLTSSAYNKGLPLNAVSQGMIINREYRDLDGNVIDEVKVGEEIVVAISAISLSGYLSSVAISDLLPGAFEFVISKGGAVTDISTKDGKRVTQGNVQGDRDMEILYADRREDRLVIFADIGTRATVFRYRVRVANRGDFAIPPVSAECMYNPSVYGTGITSIGKQNGRLTVK